MLISERKKGNRIGRRSFYTSVHFLHLPLFHFAHTGPFQIWYRSRIHATYGYYCLKWKSEFACRYFAATNSKKVDEHISLKDFLEESDDARDTSSSGSSETNARWMISGFLLGCICNIEYKFSSWKFWTVYRNLLGSVVHTSLGWRSRLRFL